MTKTYEYNVNLAIADEDTHNALVSHFNKIQKLAENKKFEWEDEEIPEENYGITFDFDVWLEYALSDMEGCYNLYQQETPKNLKENTIDYVNQIKDYIDGFMLMPIVLYNRKSIEAQSCKTVGENFDEVVEFVKELKENNKMVFLYEISNSPLYAQGVVVETGKTFNSFYKVRYGVVND